MAWSPGSTAPPGNTYLDGMKTAAAPRIPINTCSPSGPSRHRITEAAARTLTGSAMLRAGCPSKGLPAAGMLGYVMDGDTEKAWTGLVTSIDSKREDLRLPGLSQLVESQLKQHIKAGLPGTRLGETRHALVSHALRLFHLLLPVRRQSDPVVRRP